MNETKHRNSGTIILLIFFFPVGLFWMWYKKKWNVQTRWAVTIIWILILFIARPHKQGEINQQIVQKETAESVGPASNAGEVVEQYIEDVDEEKKSYEFVESKREFYGMGDIVTVEKVTYELIAVSKYSSFGEFCKPSGVFMMVKLYVTNNSKEPITFGDWGFELSDEEENKYSQSTDALGCYEDGMLLMQELQPKLRKKLNLVYDLPPGTKTYFLKVRGGMFSDAEAITYKFKK